MTSQYGVRPHMQSKEIRKILVANRSEIAIRVMRAANEIGIRTVAVFAEEDKLSLHRFKSDEAYRIGAGLGPVEAYLSIEEIIRVALQSGADAVHPGYGLLSENPKLVDACTEKRTGFHRAEGRDHAKNSATSSALVRPPRKPMSPSFRQLASCLMTWKPSDRTPNASDIR